MSVATYGDVAVTIGNDHVATVEICRPPNNFFDADLIRSLATAYETLDTDDTCRIILLCSQGKHFCAGADFVPRADDTVRQVGEDNLYVQAVRLFRTHKPVVAAVQGAAIGGGLGLACSADFRVGCPEARFAANFARLGFHHGFGLTVTLPEIVGRQHALDLLYRGRRIGGEEAQRMGLCDSVVPAAELRGAAQAFAADIAASAPLAVQSIRTTMRGDLAARVREALDRELSEQQILQATEDFREGVAATAQRRDPVFRGR